MKSSKKQKALFRRRLGISQADMAYYLAVSPSLIAMSEQDHRSLPSAALQKLAALEILFLHQEKNSSLAKQLQEKFTILHQKTAQKARRKISMHRPRAERLSQQLAGMEQQHADQLAWLSVLEEQLAASPARKYSREERLWLELQQDAVTKKLLKSKANMAKMRFDIDLLIAVAGVHEKHYGG